MPRYDCGGVENPTFCMHCTCPDVTVGGVHVVQLKDARRVHGAAPEMVCGEQRNKRTSRRECAPHMSCGMRRGVT